MPFVVFCLVFLFSCRLCLDHSNCVVPLLSITSPTNLIDERNWQTTITHHHHHQYYNHHHHYHQQQQKIGVELPLNALFGMSRDFVSRDSGFSLASPGSSLMTSSVASAAAAAITASPFPAEEEEDEEEEELEGDAAKVPVRHRLSLRLETDYSVNSTASHSDDAILAAEPSSSVSMTSLRARNDYSGSSTTSEDAVNAAASYAVASAKSVRLRSDYSSSSAASAASEDLVAADDSDCGITTSSSASSYSQRSAFEHRMSSSSCFIFPASNQRILSSPSPPPSSSSTSSSSSSPNTPRRPMKLSLTPKTPATPTASSSNFPSPSSPASFSSALALRSVGYKTSVPPLPLPTILLLPPSHSPSPLEPPISTRVGMGMGRPAADLRIGLVSMCGDPFALDMILGPFLNHQCCYITRPELASHTHSITFETYFNEVIGR